MQIRKSKKIILYLFVLLLLGTPINKNFFEINTDKFNKFEISSLSEFNDRDIINDLSNYKYQSLFLLKNEKILKTIKKYKIIEDYEFYKHYPSKLIVDLKKTKFLAITKINGVNFYVGSNGNLIKTKDDIEDLPIIFGKINVGSSLMKSFFISIKNINPINPNEVRRIIAFSKKSDHYLSLFSLKIQKL